MNLLLDPCQAALVFRWAAEERDEGQHSSRTQIQPQLSESLTPEVDNIWPHLLALKNIPREVMSELMHLHKKFRG